MLKIKIEDWYNLHKKHTFEFNEGLTCLVGRNGTGKTTLLKELKDALKEMQIKYFYYSNETSERGAMDKFLHYGDMERLARNFSSSEGQNIRNNFEDIIPAIGQYIAKCKKYNRKIAVILLDGLDSGISIDYITSIKKELFPLIIEDCKKDNIEPYIIVSANNYEFCNGEDCIRVSDAKHFKFKDYSEFRRIYINA